MFVWTQERKTEIERKYERERYRDKERDIMRKNKKIKRVRVKIRNYETVSFTFFLCFKATDRITPPTK